MFRIPTPSGKHSPMLSLTTLGVFPQSLLWMAALPAQTLLVLPIPIQVRSSEGRAFLWKGLGRQTRRSHLGQVLRQ